MKHMFCDCFQACEPAAHLALEDVNRRKDLGFRLKMHWNDSEVRESGFYKNLKLLEGFPTLI